MSGRHSYQQPQQQQQPNGEAPSSPPSALSFLHGLSEEPLHGDHACGVDSMPAQSGGAGPDALGMSARCGAADIANIAARLCFFRASH